MPSLKDAARTALAEVVALREGEEVLIVTNPEETVFPIARALYDEALALRARPVIALQEKKLTVDYAERLVLEAIKAGPDVLITMTAARLGKDPCGLHTGYVGRDGRKFETIIDKVTKGDRRARGFSTPNPSPTMFMRCVLVDYGALRARAARLKAALDVGREARVTAPGGTAIAFSIEGRRAIANDGDCRLPGKYHNLPAGEVYVSPALGSGDGVIAVDGTMSTLHGPAKPGQPVLLRLEGGFVTDISGGRDADALRETIAEGEDMARRLGDPERGRNCRHLGEFGIGINDKAEIHGTILEDEKVLGTCHFALGSNYDFDAPAIIHRDMLVLRPTVFIDGRKIMENGDLLI